MPTFCRHNRFVQNCPICRQELEPQSVAAPRGRGTGTRSRPGSPRTQRPGGGSGVRVRHETRAGDDGYRSALVPGLRASDDARRLAQELAFAAGRLAVLGSAPPGLYGEARAQADPEEAAWLCFLIAYLSPLDGPDPFAGVRAVRRPWRAAEPLTLEDAALGPRSSHGAAPGERTLAAYRHWAARAGSQSQALLGDPAWSAQRRFERIYERLALPGLRRAGRYDLLATLGALGLVALDAATLALTEDDAATQAAKRVFGIGDRINLERRAAALAAACELPLASLDLGLANWAATERMTQGVDSQTLDGAARARVEAALGL